MQDRGGLGLVREVKVNTNFVNTNPLNGNEAYLPARVHGFCNISPVVGKVRQLFFCHVVTE